MFICKISKWNENFQQIQENERILIAIRIWAIFSWDLWTKIWELFWIYSRVNENNSINGVVLRILSFLDIYLHGFIWRLHNPSESSCTIIFLLFFIYRKLGWSVFWYNSIQIEFNISTEWSDVLVTVNNENHATDSSRLWGVVGIVYWLCYI